MPDNDDAQPPDRPPRDGWEALAQVIAGIGQAAERSAVGLSQGVAAVNDWLAHHQPETVAISRWSRQAGEWAARHHEEITAVAMWAEVARACKQSDLYAPMSPAWKHIAREAHEKNAADLEDLILNAYTPGDLGYASLREELRSAEVLADRRDELQEVLASLEEGRHYVVICGALPLAEGVLVATHGRWRNKLDDYPFNERLHDEHSLTEEEIADLLLNKSALDMALNATDGIWSHGRHQAGAFTTKLNRNVALHGTGYGWHTQHNAVRSVLLLAAMARVAGPLLGPRPDKRASAAS